MSDDNQSSIDELQQQIQNLQKQNTQLTKALDNTKSIAAQFDGLDPDKAIDAIKFKDEATRKQLEAAGDYKKALQAETEKFNQALSVEQEKVKNLNTQLAKTLVDGEIVNAISKAGGKLRPLSALINEENLVRVVNDAGQLKARVFAKDSDLLRTLPNSDKPMNVDELVRELANDKELAGLFPASGNSGSGAPPSQLSAGHSHQSVIDFKGNLTDQAKSIKTRIGA